MRLFFLALPSLVFCLATVRVHSQHGLNEKCDSAETLVKAGRANEAIAMLREVLSNEMLEDSVKAKAYAQYGLGQRLVDNLDSGIYFLQRAAKIWHARNDNKHLFKVYQDIASLLSVKTDFRETIKFYKDALHYAASNDDSAEVYVRICALLLQNERYDSAYQVVQTSIGRYASGNREKVPYERYYAELAKGLYFKSKRQYAKAIPHLTKAASSFVTDDSYTLNAFALLAETYQENKDYRNGFRYADSANALLREDSWIFYRLQLHDLYTDLHEAAGNHLAALHYAKLSRQLSDSFYREEETAALTDAAEKYKNEKIQAEKELAEKDRAIMSRNFIFTGIALVLVALLALLFLRNARIRRKANLLLTQQKQQVQELADQLAVANHTKARLFSTIGHDLRSPVSSLYASLKMMEIKGAAGDNSMSEHTVQLLDTLEDLLAWSKSQMDGFTVQKVKVSVPLLMQDLGEFYATAAAAKGIVVANNVKEKIVLHTDENILKTVLRNAISNAVAHTTPGNAVRLSAHTDAAGIVHLAVANPCSESSFHRFQSRYHEAAVQSGAHGLGTVLIKEFAQKISATVRLSYTDGCAILDLSFLKVNPN